MLPTIDCSKNEPKNLPLPMKTAAELKRPADDVLRRMIWYANAPGIVIRPRRTIETDFRLGNDASWAATNLLEAPSRPPRCQPALRPSHAARLTSQRA